MSVTFITRDMDGQLPHTRVVDAHGELANQLVWAMTVIDEQPEIHSICILNAVPDWQICANMIRADRVSFQNIRPAFLTAAMPTLLGESPTSLRSLRDEYWRIDQNNNWELHVDGWIDRSGRDGDWLLNAKPKTISISFQGVGTGIDARPVKSTLKRQDIWCGGDAEEGGTCHYDWVLAVKDPMCTEDSVYAPAGSVTVWRDIGFGWGAPFAPAAHNAPPIKNGRVCAIYY